MNKNEILDLKYLRFIENHENIIFLGPPGVGKTHLSIAIGMETALNRISTYFISCHDLIMQLKRSYLENRLEQRIRHFTSYAVLIIDEVGYLPLDKDASNLLFQLIAKRYEKKTTIITTNKNITHEHYQRFGTEWRVEKLLQLDADSAPFEERSQGHRLHEAMGRRARP